MQQQQLLASLVERLQRGLALVAVDINKLTGCRQELSKSLKDKVTDTYNCVDLLASHVEHRH